MASFKQPTIDEVLSKPKVAVQDLIQLEPADDETAAALAAVGVTEYKAKAPCAKCGECPLRKRPFVPSKFTDSDVLIIGEAPGEMEVQAREPFAGQSGQLVNGALRRSGKVDPRTISKTNVVLCRPAMNATPDDAAIAACRPRLENEIAQSKAKRVAVLGSTAHHALADMLHLERGFVYNKWTEHDGRQYLALRHPAYVLRQPNEYAVWARGIQKFAIGPRKHPVQQQPKVIIFRDLDQFKAWWSHTRRGQWVSFDVETEQVKYYDRRDGQKKDRLLMLAMSRAYGEGVIIPEEQLHDPAWKGYLNRIFRQHKRWVAHNSKFDMTFLRAYGIHAVCQFDTILAHYCLDENKGTHGLKMLATEYFDVEDYEHRLVKKYLRSREDKYSKIPFEPLAQYAAWDVTITLALRDILEVQLKREGMLEWPFYNILMPAIEAYTCAEMRGMKVDLAYLEAQHEMLNEEIEEYAAELRRISGKPDLNPNSSVQLSKIVYDELKMPLCKRKNTSPRSTSKAAIADLILLLEEQGRHLPEFLAVLRQYRRSQKILSTYVEPLLAVVDPNGRVHPRFALYGTETGRITVTDPPIHTIPRPNDKYGKMLRGAFTCEEDSVLMIIDFSQAEFRYFAAVTGDPFLLGAYKAGRDLHSEVAERLRDAILARKKLEGVEIPWEEVRRIAKTWNFSNVYGESEKSSGKMHQIPTDMAAELYHYFRGLMPVAIAWKKSQYEVMKKQGFVQSRFNRKRRFPLINLTNGDEARKSSFNSPIQGAASDITMMAFTRLNREGYNVLMTVHDSIFVECREEDAERVKAYVEQVMTETAAKYVPEVPWKVDGGYDKRWKKY